MKFKNLLIVICSILLFIATIHSALAWNVTDFADLEKYPLYSPLNPSEIIGYSYSHSCSGYEHLTPFIVGTEDKTQHCYQKITLKNPTGININVPLNLIEIFLDRGYELLNITNQSYVTYGFNKTNNQSYPIIKYRNEWTSFNSLVIPKNNNQTIMLFTRKLPEELVTWKSNITISGYGKLIFDPNFAGINKSKASVSLTLNGNNLYEGFDGYNTTFISGVYYGNSGIENSDKWTVNNYFGHIFNISVQTDANGNNNLMFYFGRYAISNNPYLTTKQNFSNFTLDFQLSGSTSIYPHLYTRSLNNNTGILINSIGQYFDLDLPAGVGFVQTGGSVADCLAQTYLNLPASWHEWRIIEDGSNFSVYNRSINKDFSLLCQGYFTGNYPITGNISFGFEANNPDLFLDDIAISEHISPAKNTTSSDGLINLNDNVSIKFINPNPDEFNSFFSNSWADIYRNGIYYKTVGDNTTLDKDLIASYNFAIPYNGSDLSNSSNNLIFNWNTTWNYGCLNSWTGCIKTVGTSEGFNHTLISNPIIFGNNWTFGGWFNIGPSSDNWNPLLNDITGYGIGLTTRTSFTCAYYNETNNEINLITSYTPPQNTWVSLLCSKNETHLSAWANGVLVGSTNAYGNSITSNNGATAGSIMGLYTGQSGWHANGSAILIHFFNRSLTKSEILDDYNREKTNFTIYGSDIGAGNKASAKIYVNNLNHLFDSVMTENVTVALPSTYPAYYNIAKNQTTIYQNQWINFSSYWEDTDIYNRNLSGYIFEINQTGNFVNSSSINFPTIITSNSINITKNTSISDVSCGDYFVNCNNVVDNDWTSAVTGSGVIMTTTGLYINYSVPSDNSYTRANITYNISLPQTTYLYYAAIYNYSSNSFVNVIFEISALSSVLNSTIINLSAYGITDKIETFWQFKRDSGAGFSITFYETNITWIGNITKPVGNQSTSFNLTKITAPPNSNISWRFYANNTQGNWNVTPLQTFLVETQPPTATITISPTNPYRITNLSCNITGTSINGVGLNISKLNWYKNNALNLSFYNISIANGTMSPQTLNYNNLTLNDNWYCNATVYDGQLSSINYNSTTTTVRDYANISTLSLSANLSIIYVNNNTFLSCNYTSNGTSTNLKWYKNNLTYLTFTGLNNDTNQTLASGNFTNVDVWKCEVTAIGDWSTTGYAKNSSTITVYDNLVYNYTLNQSSTVFESNYANFWFNFTYSPYYLNNATTYANFTYNNTIYPSNIVYNKNGSIYWNATVIIPYVEVDFTNKTLYWNVTAYYYNGSIKLLNYTANQSIEKYNLFFCTTAKENSSVAVMNFTFSQERNLGTTLNANFAITAISWSSNQTNNQSLSFNITNVPTVQLCISPPNETRYLDAQIRYDSADYSQRYYYFQNYTANNNSMSNYTLYLLESNLSTNVQFLVTNEVDIEEPNIYITLQRYYVEAGIYKSVAMGLTDSDGSFVIPLELITGQYRTILQKNYAVVLTTTKKQIISSPYPLKLSPSTNTGLREQFKSIVYSLTFNNATKTFSLTFQDVTGATSENCLYVVNKTARKDWQVCDICLTTSSGTINCPLGNTSAVGLYSATYYSKINPENAIYSMLWDLNAPVSLVKNVGRDGLILTFFTVLSSAGVGMLIAGPVGMIFLPILAFIGISFLGFTYLPYYVLLLIVIAGVGIAWKLKT